MSENDLNMNKTNNIMNELNINKRNYTDLDIDILDEYRTHVSNGLLNTIENKKII